MRTRTIATPVAEALRRRVDHDGTVRTALACGVSPRTLNRALGGAPVQFAVAARLEASAV